MDVFEEESHDESVDEAYFASVLEPVSQSFENCRQFFLEEGHHRVIRWRRLSQ